MYRTWTDRCRTCPTHPKLVMSGRPAPADRKCPVCDTTYDSVSSVPTDYYLQAEQEYHDKLAKEREARAKARREKREEIERNKYELPEDALLSQEEIDEILDGFVGQTS